MSYKNIIDAVDIPEYTHKQDGFNAFSHLLGIPLAVFILVYGLVLYIQSRLSLFHLVGLLIFSLSMAAVYLVSFMYHGASKVSFKKKFLRILDHSTIYLLIAGTYTPICFVILETNIIGLIMLIIEWSGALFGIILNMFLFKHKWASITSFVLYLVMGWLCLFCGGFLYMPIMSFAFILAGGITYTIGSILYGIGHKNMTFHSVFHVFVLLGTIIQTIGVLFIV